MPCLALVSVVQRHCPGPEDVRGTRSLVPRLKGDTTVSSGSPSLRKMRPCPQGAPRITRLYFLSLGHSPTQQIFMELKAWLGGRAVNRKNTSTALRELTFEREGVTTHLFPLPQP